MSKKNPPSFLVKNLLPGPQTNKNPFSNIGKNIIEGDITSIPIDKIIPNPDQPRKKIDEKKLQELVESIKEHNILQPIVVTKHNDGYMLVAGERRWRACITAGKKEIPAIVRHNLNTSDILILGLIENIQREDLNFLDRAIAIRNLWIMKNRPNHAELGKILGFSKQRIQQFFNVLKLPPDIIEKFKNNTMLGDKHVRALSKLNNDKEQLYKFLDEIIENNYSGSEALEKVNDYIKNTKKNYLKNVSKDCMAQYTKIKNKWDKLDDLSRQNFLEELRSLKNQINQYIEELEGE